MPIRELLTIADLLTDPLALVCVDGRIDTPNEAFADRLGIAANALTGRRLDALAVASAAAIQEYLRACAESTKVIPRSVLLRRRAETLALEVRGVAYPPSAAPGASQVLLRLVTDRESARAAPNSEQPSHHWREIEDSLRRHSQILQVTLASIGDAVIVTDARGQVTFLNSVAEGLTGWPAQEGKGRPLKEIFPIVNERTRQPVEDPVSKVLQSGATVGLANHTVLLARQGREIPIDDSAAPIRLPSGELIGVVLIFRDIAEQRRAEHARAWLAAIVDSSDDAIVSKTLDGIITSWNPAASRLFGYAPQEIVGKSIITIVPPELHEEEEQVLARLRAGERLEHFETVRIAKNGRRIEVSLTVSPIRDEAGEIVGASKIARDITEHKRAERALRDADHRKDEFLAVLAHELRNPLAPIRNAAEILCRIGPVRPELQSACDIMDRQLRHMTRLLDDVLDVARIGTGRIELHSELIDVGLLLQTLEGSFRLAFEAAQQHSAVVLPEDPVYVCGDRTRLTQVFSNLLQNANKYTPSGGKIAVEVRHENGNALVSVRDTGIGIPPVMLEQVFELFAQVDRSSHRSGGGVGIGLALAKRLTELHGGRIEARSAGEGRGSEFIVRLPACKPPASMPMAPEARNAIDSPRKVLIADDDHDAAVTLGMLLTSMGHETCVVHDGLSAVEMAEAFRPDVVILDIAMPRLDGYEAARAIAARPWSTSTLLVALTGMGQPENREHAEEAGFKRYLLKPLDTDDLGDLMAQCAQSNARGFGQ